MWQTTVGNIFMTTGPTVTPRGQLDAERPQRMSYQRSRPKETLRELVILDAIPEDVKKIGLGEDYVMQFVH
jgi:hypothetical protein